MKYYHNLFIWVCIKRILYRRRKKHEEFGGWYLIAQQNLLAAGFANRFIRQIKTQTFNRLQSSWIKPSYHWAFMQTYPIYRTQKMISSTDCNFASNFGFFVGAYAAVAPQILEMDKDEYWLWCAVRWLRPFIQFCLISYRKFATTNWCTTAQKLLLSSKVVPTVNHVRFGLGLFTQCFFNT